MAILLLLANLISFIMVGALSYYYIYVVQVQKMNDNLQELVNSEVQTIEKLLSDMNFASQMLVVEDGLGMDVLAFFAEQDNYQRAYLFRTINNTLANIYLSNPNLGAVFYYFPDIIPTVQFSNFHSQIDFRPESLPLLYHANQFTYYGPHASVDPLNASMVLSLVRMMIDDNGQPFYVYLETKLGNHMENVFTDTFLGLSVIHSVLSHENQTLYEMAGAANEKETHLFTSGSDAGWAVSLVVPERDYSNEIMKWRFQFLLVSMGSLLISLLIAWKIWNMVSRPLRQMHNIVNQFGVDLMTLPASKFELIEFQDLYMTFENARERIVDLIGETEKREKQQAQLEVEKLLAQINPHFIHNTLNTIQWMARMHGQTDIVTLVTLFTRVLHYNMGKNSIIVTLGQEINAVRDYIELQNIRYENVFRCRIEIEPETEGLPIPRFALQPLVENALFHGVENHEGEIRIQVHKNDENALSIKVSDNGKGMSPKRLEEIQKEDDTHHNSGMGIGLSYVRRMLDTFYGSNAKFEITSEVDVGTNVYLYLPTKALVP
jgi:two-component system sensor histidine kinase YesM